MKARINRDLLRGIKPEGKAYEIIDTDTPGFIARVSAIGTVKFAVRYLDSNGKQMRRSLKMSFPQNSVDEARAEAKRIAAQMTTGAITAEKQKAEKNKKLTLKEFIDGDYGDHLRAKNKAAEASIERLKRCFAKFMDLALPEIDAVSIEKWRNEKLNSGMSVSTVNRDIGALKPVFSRAVDWRILPENPLKPIKPIKDSSDPIIRYLDKDEEKRLRTALDKREKRERDARKRGNQWRSIRKYELLPDIPETHYVDYLKPAVLLSINTGIRQGELINLLWDDVHFEPSQYLYIRGEYSKSSKGRHVPLNDEAKAVLTQWKMQHNGKGLVFPGREGKPIAEVKTAWRKLLIDAEILDFRWHDMRHHFASRLVMAGVDLDTVRELLGHSDLKMTLRYAHLAPEHKAAAVQKLMRKL